MDGVELLVELVELPLLDERTVDCDDDLVGVDSLDLVDVPALGLVDVPEFDLVDVPEFDLVVVPEFDLVVVPVFDLVDIPELERVAAVEPDLVFPLRIPLSDSYEDRVVAEDLPATVEPVLGLTVRPDPLEERNRCCSEFN